jgi:hypothetical protein
VPAMENSIGTGENDTLRETSRGKTPGVILVRGRAMLATLEYSGSGSDDLGCIRRNFSIASLATRKYSYI